MNNHIGEKISIERKKKNLSQKQLANKLNVSNKTISKWECGNGTPDIDALNKMSDIFAITLDELVNSKPDTRIETKDITIKKSINKKVLLFSAISLLAVLIAILSVVCYFFIPRNPIIKDSVIFKINNEEATLYCSVSNDTNFLSLENAIELPLTNKWELYLDINATNKINSKAVNLEIGDNTYYILITNNSGKQKIYKVNIRRRPLYTISFNSGGGTDVKSIQIEEGDLIKENNIISPELNGYIFNGWDFDFNTKIYEDITINAKWTSNTYKIVYKSNNNTHDIEQIVYFNESVQLYSNIFIKNHYYIDKWNSKADGTGINYSLSQNISKYNTPNDLVVYAIWKPISYHITYHLNEGINSNQNIKSYNIESNNFSLLQPTRSGYDFGGWFTDSNYDNSIETIEQGTFGDLDIYAYWIPHPYMIIYHLDDGINNILNPNNYNVEDSNIELKNPTKAYNVFDGWYIDNKFQTKEIKILDTSTKEDINLYAKWIDSTFTAISNFEDLKNLKNNLNGKYYFTNDIVLEEDDVWETIATTADTGFTGLIDGCGYSILNLNETFIEYNYGIIKNISLQNFSLVEHTSGYYASLITRNYGKVINCVANGEISINGEIGILHVGGLIATSNYKKDGDNYAIIENCASNIKINIETKMVSKDEINSNNSINVAGLCEIGTNIYNSYSTGAIEINVKNMLSIGDDTKLTLKVGGLIGNLGIVDFSINNCYSTSDIKCNIFNCEGLFYVAGLCAYGDVDKFSNCFVDNNIEIYTNKNISDIKRNFLLNQEYNLSATIENGYYKYGESNYILGNKKITIKEEGFAIQEHLSPSKIIDFASIKLLMNFDDIYFKIAPNDYPKLKIFN